MVNNVVKIPKKSTLLLFCQDKWQVMCCKESQGTKFFIKFDFSTMIPQVDLFSFIFWEKLKTPKQHFEINWPLDGKNIKSVQKIIDICLKTNYWFGMQQFQWKQSKHSKTKTGLLGSNYCYCISFWINTSYNLMIFFQLILHKT